MADKEINYKCLSCGKKWTFKVDEKDMTKLKDKKSCISCRKKKKLQKKANKRGKRKDALFP